MKFFTLDFWTRGKLPELIFPADESKREGRTGAVDSQLREKFNSA